MKKLLIIYPHWYPSNLAGVHRPRLTCNYLYEKGWHPIILTVKPEYYEEIPDTDMHRLFSPHFVECRVDAMKVRKPRIIGDIGLRAFYQLYQMGKEIIRTEKPDLLWIPIPSFYTAILGRLLHASTHVPYGIDYIDPWVRDISKDRSLRARLSLAIAKFLEPIAVKNANLITGVAYEYYKPVLDRNFKDSNTYLVIDAHSKEPIPPGSYREAIGTKGQDKRRKIFHAAFPYGFDPRDHEIEIPDLRMPWDDRQGVIPIVYAGAFMPNSQYFLDILFRAFSFLVKENKVPSGIQLYFLGTGNYPHKSILAYALDHGISNYVTEIRERFPYLHILNFLAKANRLLIIGSTEKHYAASKTFQVILSKRPFFAMFHNESSAIEILQNTETNHFLVRYQPGESEEILYHKTKKTLEDFLQPQLNWNPQLTALEPFSARSSARTLSTAMNLVLEYNKH